MTHKQSQSQRPALFHSALTWSRVALGAFIVLACLSPSWDKGPFSWLPLYRFTSFGQTFTVGIVLVLPVIAWTLWGVVWFSAPVQATWRWGRWPVALPVFGFGAWALARSWPVHSLQVAVLAAVGIALFWMIYLYTVQAGTARWVTTLLAVVMLVQGCVAVAQFLAQRSLGLAWMGELTLAPEVRGVSVVEAAGQRWLRAYGLTPHPNVLGGYLGVGILICLNALPGATVRRRWLLAACILTGGLGLFCTFSRSAWLGTLAGLAYWVWITRAWRWARAAWRAVAVRRVIVLLTVSVVVIVAVVTVAYDDLILARLSTSSSELETSSVNERLRDIKLAWGLIRQVPLKGVGTGYYVPALWANAGDDRPPAFQHVHNIPLLAAAELGIGGALLWLWLVGWPPLEGLWDARRRRQRQPCCDAPVAGWAAAFVVMGVVSMLDYYLYIPATWWPAFYIGMLAGVWAGPSNERKEQA